MEINDIKKIIEALLFVSDKPLLSREIKTVIKEDLPENVKVDDILKEMQQEYIQLDRAFELKFLADGWTFSTKSQYSNWVRKLLKEKTILKLSPSAMEVLAIIAYKQPITRAEIDVIRGVDCGGVIDTLVDRNFIKIVGRKETLGRPLLYGTTQEFLRHFGLSHLSELPVIDGAKDVLVEQQEIVQELPFESQTNKEKNIEKTEEQDLEIKKEETNFAETENSVTEKVEQEQSSLENKNENQVESVQVQNENIVKENEVDVVIDGKENTQNDTEK